MAMSVGRRAVVGTGTAMSGRLRGLMGSLIAGFLLLHARIEGVSNREQRRLLAAGLAVLVKHSQVFDHLADRDEVVGARIDRRGALGVGHEERDWFLVLAEVDCDLIRLGSSLFFFVLHQFALRCVLNRCLARTEHFLIAVQVVDFALDGLELRGEARRAALELEDFHAAAHLELRIDQVHLNQLQILLVLLRRALIRRPKTTVLLLLMLTEGLTRSVLQMEGAYVFSPRRDDHALVDELLVEANVEVLVNLAVVDESQVAMFLQVALPHAVDGIDGAPLELVDVAGDDLGSGLDVGHEHCDLVFARKLSKGLPGSVPHLKVPV